MKIVCRLLFGIHWQTAEWVALSLRYDEAFRAPSTTELYMEGTHFSIPGMGINSFIANPDLSPEKSHNIEFKADFGFEDIFADDALTLTTSVFYNRVEDFINLDVDMMTMTSTSENIDNAELKGFEIASNYRIGSFNGGLSYGQTRGEDDDTNEWIDNIPTDKWTLDLNYGFWDIDTKVGARAIFAEEQDRVESDEVYDAYTTVDFYASWEPTNQLTGLKLDFTVSNAFDENYRTAWSNVYEIGRSFKFSAQYDF